MCIGASIWGSYEQMLAGHQQEHARQFLSGKHACRTRGGIDCPSNSRYRARSSSEVKLQSEITTQPWPCWSCSFLLGARPKPVEVSRVSTQHGQARFLRFAELSRVYPCHPRSLPSQRGEGSTIPTWVVHTALAAVGGKANKSTEHYVQLGRTGKRRGGVSCVPRYTGRMDTRASTLQLATLTGRQAC